MQQLDLVIVLAPLFRMLHLLAATFSLQVEPSFGRDQALRVSMRQTFAVVGVVHCKVSSNSEDAPVSLSQDPLLSISRRQALAVIYSHDSPEPLPSCLQVNRHIALVADYARRDVSYMHNVS